MESCVLIGGSGIAGEAVARAFLDAGRNVSVLDSRPPSQKLMALGVQWLAADLLADDLPALPDGDVVILLGPASPRSRWPWFLPVCTAVATARILPALAGRRVTLMSSAEIYGSAPAPLTEDSPPELPLTLQQIDEWCDDAMQMAGQPCPPWRCAPLGRRMADSDPTGRWVYAMSKLAQERLVARVSGAEHLTILRPSDVFGAGQEHLVTRLIRKALAADALPVTSEEYSFVPVTELARIIASGLAPGIYNLGSEHVPLHALAAEIRDLCGSVSPLEPGQPPGPASHGLVDSSRLAAAGQGIGALRPHLEAMVEAVRADGCPVFEPALPVVIPPRAAYPDQVAARQQASLWRGEVKHGNQWSKRLLASLAEELGVGDEHALFITTSGTSALRLVIAATAGTAAPGDVAILPSFTFPATAEVLLQLGYRLRFIDVDERTWTIHPDTVAAALAAGPARVVVCVDTFGNPCDYEALRPVCREAGVPLIADSAASIGSRYQGRPFATQADGHAYSMSFAKVLSAGGAGGAAVLPADVAAAMLRHRSGWWRSELMDELHAIYALDQLAMLEDLVRRRNRIAEIYTGGLDLVPHLAFQEVRPADTHSYVHWVTRVSPLAGRDALQDALEECGLQTKPYFRALHMTGFGNGEQLPVTQRLDGEVLALPMSSELTEDDAQKVVLAVQHRVARVSALSAPAATRRRGTW